MKVLPEDYQDYEKTWSKRSRDANHAAAVTDIKWEEVSELLLLLFITQKGLMKN